MSLLKSLSLGINKIFSKNKINERSLDDLYDILIMSDLGTMTTDEIISRLKKRTKSDSNIEDIKKEISNTLNDILHPFQKKFFNEIHSNNLNVIVFNGVNGSGKTTTIPKIANRLKNKKVMIAACDTFRAAAVDQLETWSSRVKCQIFKPDRINEDPSSVIYKSVNFALDSKIEYLLVDTAGRLQNKKDLMDQIKKMSNVVKNIKNDICLKNFLVLDGTSGYNIISQVKLFNSYINIDGLIVTKLDGSAKGGALVDATRQFRKDIYLTTNGEKIDNLNDFSSVEYSNNIVGIE